MLIQSENVFLLSSRCCKYIRGRNLVYFQKGTVRFVADSWAFNCVSTEFFQYNAYCIYCLLRDNEAFCIKMRHQDSIVEANHDPHESNAAQYRLNAKKS